MVDGSDSVSKLFTTLRKVPGLDVDQLEASLADYEKHGNKPVVTLFGAYDTGKTSLLKRLLIDAGAPVPAWATISAKHETFQAADAEAPRWVLRDTPGVRSGIAAHQDRALEALALSDAWLVMLPPQLLTGEGELVRELLTGKIFHPGGCVLPAPALQIVVSRMDEAGVDPVESPGEYRALIDQKAIELGSMLARLGFTLRPDSVHFVAADAFQRIGNRVDVSRGNYDATRQWDGVDRLTAWIDQLSEHLPVLRTAARRRFAMQAGSRALLALEDERSRQKEARDEAARMTERRRLIRGQFDALVGAAEAELPGVVEEELLAVGRLGQSEPDAMQQALEPRLLESLDRWATRHNASLAKLADDVGLELEAGRTRPAAILLANYFQAPSTPSRVRDSKAPEGIVDRFRTAFQSLVDVAHQIHVGDELETGRKRWNEAQQKGWTSFTTSAAKKAAKKSGRYVMVHDTVAAAGPAAVELARFIAGQAQERREERARAEYREKLRTQLADAARRLARAFFHGDAANDIEGWKSHTDALSAAIDQAFRPHDEARQSLDKSLGQLEEFSAAITAAVKSLR